LSQGENICGEIERFSSGMERELAEDRRLDVENGLLEFSYSLYSTAQGRRK